MIVPVIHVSLKIASRKLSVFIWCKTQVDCSLNYLFSMPRKQRKSLARSCFRRLGGRREDGGSPLIVLSPPIQVRSPLQTLEGADHRGAPGALGDRGGAQLLQEPRGGGADGGALVLHHRP